MQARQLASGAGVASAFTLTRNGGGAVLWAQRMRERDELRSMDPAACRDLVLSPGDIASDSPELSKPAWLAGSTGNSFVGRMSTPVKS